MSTEQWQQIKRRMSEQDSFLQLIISQRQQKAHRENNGIWKTQQMLGEVERKTEPATFDNGQESVKEPKEEGSSMVGAMRRLQEKMGKLQQLNQRCERWRSEV
jgi:hypothetical protein